jgi:uncharacterized protein YbaR (Trm112 family)/SAM-dependent methyltransferase
MESVDWLSISRTSDWGLAIHVSELLVCPITRRSLVEVDRQLVFDALGANIGRLAANRATVSREQVTDKALLRSDGRGAYPVVEGIPILLAPEMLVSIGDAESIDTDQDPYREAYEEMDFYNAEAARANSDVSNSDAYQMVSPALNAGSFSGPDWLDAMYDKASQADAYEFMSPMKDMKALQLGGSGIHAVKFLLAGASESWLLTPMLGEAMLARDLAAAFGVEAGFRSVIGIAEEIPLHDASFDRVYSGGCIHHTITQRAFPEIRRVLRPGGKFAAIEPWRAPMYRVGTKVFGKRERGVKCRPMEQDRVRPLFNTFDSATVTHHGTFTRYPLIALGKLGIRPRSETVDRITRFDDKLASKSSLRRYGSSVALLAESTG